jgi:hypothetical protein
MGRAHKSIQEHGVQYGVVGILSLCHNKHKRTGMELAVKIQTIQRNSARKYRPMRIFQTLRRLYH